MWNQTNKSIKQLKRSTSLLSHWFPVEKVHNGPKLCKCKLFSFCCQNFSDVFRVCHMKADVRPILKMWCFFLLSFKPEFLLLKVGSNRQKYCEAASKNKYAFDFDFLPPYWISVGPIGMFWVFKPQNIPIQWQNLKRKIVAVFIFWRRKKNL